MEVVLLASMRREVGFNKGPSMNGINLKIVCSCCEKNVFKDPDDEDEGFVLPFATLEHRIVCFILHQEKKKNLIWSHSTFVFWPVRVGFLFWRLSEYCMCNEQRGDSSWFVFQHHQSHVSTIHCQEKVLPQCSYFYWSTNQQKENWKLCRHSYGHHCKADSSISDIVEIPIHDYIKTRWIDLSPHDDTDDSDHQLLYSLTTSVWLIGVMNN